MKRVALAFSILVAACLGTEPRNNPYDLEYAGLELSVAAVDGVVRVTWDNAQVAAIAAMPVMTGASWTMEAVFVCESPGPCDPQKDSIGIGAEPLGAWNVQRPWPGGKKTVTAFLSASIGGRIYEIGRGKLTSSDFDGDGVAASDCDDSAATVPACDAHATCVTSASGNRCRCDEGWQGDGATCVDVDECIANACGRGTCSNFVGGYACSCDVGYEEADGTCKDLDECQNAPCGVGTCANTLGAYLCVCPIGYVSDGTTCIDVDECAKTNGGCDENATCTNKQGTHECACNYGFDGDGESCDRNECVLDAINCAGVGTCVNTVASYRCDCASGYTRSGQSCVDLDECAEAPCGNGTCENSIGSYNCICRGGWRFDGTTCVDVNECSGVNQCSVSANCSNTVGSYGCTCKAGWTGDGFSCSAITCSAGEWWDGSVCLPCTRGYSSGGGYVTQCSDIDECKVGTPCDVNATCANITGSFTCTCKSGYTGNGTTCRLLISGDLVTKTLAGQTFEFSHIAAGAFLMGTSGSGSDENPQHSVTLTRPFLLQRTETTQAQYQAVLGINPSYFTGDARRPVERVSWTSALAYCDQLSQLEGVANGTYGLPTEAQWEYAARAGTTGASYGNLSDIAWYYDNSGNQTHAVMGKLPNAWNLYDMLGNVWEWTADWYSTNYYASSPSSDPPGPTSGSYRVGRGGCWYHGASHSRAARRYGDDPGYTYCPLGFRPRRSLP